MMARLALRTLVTVLPAYAAAYLTGEMVYVVPTLAASFHFANALPLRVDDDGDDGGQDGGE